MTKETQQAAGLTSHLTQELDLALLNAMVEKTELLKKQKRDAEWAIIRLMTKPPLPEKLLENHTLFVGRAVCHEVERVLGYTPNFVQFSRMLKDEQTVLIFSSVSFNKLEFKYL